MVRSAGLWEYPVGQMALTKGTTKAVRIAGEHLIEGRAALDASSRRVAARLDITLPNRPSPQQQGFVATLKADSGKRLDTDMVTLLRATDGQALSTIASVRTTTRNSLVRTLADQANDTDLDHLTVLEKTGLVDFGQVLSQETTAPTLPAQDMTPPPPAATQPQVVLTPQANSTLSPSPSVG